MKLLDRIFGRPPAAAAPSPQPGPEPAPAALDNSSLPQTKDWTILLYGAGNCSDTEFDLQATLDSWQRVQPGAKVTLAAEVSRYSEGGKAYRYSFEDGQKNLVADLGPTNMGKGQTLEEFLNWGIQKFPAKHYMVILAGHGGAYQGGYPDKLANDHLDLSELKNALESAKTQANQPIDVLVHKACFMSNAEVAQSFSHSVDYMVASESISYEGNPNLWMLADKMKFLTAQDCAPEGVSGAQAAQAVLESVETVTANCISRPAQMSSLIPLIQDFAESLLRCEQPVDELRKVFRSAGNFADGLYQENETPNYSSVRDLRQLAATVAHSQLPDPDLKASAQQLLDGVQQSGVIVKGLRADHPSMSKASGLSIWAPTGEIADSKLEEYAQSDFAQATGWDRVVQKLGQLQSAGNAGKFIPS